MNLPNKLTVLRIALIPVCVVLLSLGKMTAAAIVFAAAAFTDFLDGYIARRQKLVTVFGKFADPVADKLLVLTAMICLTAQGRIPAWAVCVVAARELMVDGLRLVAVERDIVIAAGLWGKCKTVSQFFCVLIAMLMPETVVLPVLIYLMAALTVVSGVLYFIRARSVFGGETA